MNAMMLKSIVIAVSVVLLSSFVGTVMWTANIGYRIWYDIQDTATTLYSESGLAMMIDQHNLESIDSCNLYKMLQVNSSNIRDFRISKLDGNMVTSYEQLLRDPLARFEVTITGDPNIGFYIEADEIEVEREF